ncbi:MAG: hypothetical protein ACJA0Q_000138 [Saprospiraceae bacterium]|jgi:hypothetical protein
MEFFSMTDKTWERHSNPWSVWTRMITLPFLVLTIWSRIWIDWYAWVILGLLVMWLVFNPKAFARPKSTKNWASKAVLGERVWLNRKKIGIPKDHAFMATLLNTLNGLGLPFLIYGLYNFDFWPTVLGTIIIYAGKMWFLDRMVWLFEDMKDKDDKYASWEY